VPTHRIARSPATSPDLPGSDDDLVDDWDYSGYPWWVRFIARRDFATFAHAHSHSLMDRIDYAFDQRTQFGKTASVVFIFATLLPIGILRWIEWAYFDRFPRACIAWAVTPFFIALLNALPVTSWLLGFVRSWLLWGLTDGWDPIGSLFHPTDMPVDLPVDGE
jgi:hypothetical protein